MKIKKIFILSIITILMLMISCSKDKPIHTGKKAIILGFDGMDPDILRNYISKGLCPNFNRLTSVGDFKDLKTSNPPQSPVAWSNFITGANPGTHNIFDFIHRDPLTLSPYLSISRSTVPDNFLNLFSYRLPLSSGKVKLLRKGTSFWSLLSKHKIYSKIYRVPSNFPPEKNPYNESLSGMGTPDILGGYGQYTFITDNPDYFNKKVTGGNIIELDNLKSDIINTNLIGPVNIYKKNMESSKQPITIIRDNIKNIVEIQINDEKILLNKGEWSKWVTVKFEMIPFISTVYGICRFYIRNVHPYLELYVTPVNIHPEHPAMPISHPEEYSAELARQGGLFYNQGMPEQTKSLDENILSESEYIEQAKMILKEREKFFNIEYKKFNDGLFFYYFSSTDQNMHMYYRLIDSKHPMYDKELAAKYGNFMKELYIDMDSIVGKVLKDIDENTLFIIMSDHGFAPFYYTFNVTSFLYQNGYMNIIDEEKKYSAEQLDNIDWFNTRAYNIGLNSLYINLAGREKYGIVTRGAEYKNLVKELCDKLEAIVDPNTGLKAINKCYLPEDIYSGQYVKNAPDIILGFKPPYRISWDAAVTRITDDIFGVNNSKWSGDHCMDPEFIPGIIVTNKKIKRHDPALYDIPVSILHFFNVEKDNSMIGRNLF